LLSQVLDFQGSFSTKNFKGLKLKFQALGIQISSRWNFIFERSEFLRKPLPEKQNNCRTGFSQTADDRKDAPEAGRQIQKGATS